MDHDPDIDQVAGFCHRDLRGHSRFLFLWMVGQQADDFCIEIITKDAKRTFFGVINRAVDKDIFFLFDRFGYLAADMEKIQACPRIVSMKTGYFIGFGTGGTLCVIPFAGAIDCFRVGIF